MELLLLGLAIQQLRNTLNRFGMEICRTDYLEYRAFAWHLHHLFKSLEIDCVLDVGANTGGYRDFLREHVRYEGWILSFEPVRQCVEKLNARAASDPKWAVYDFALGSKDETKDINIMRADTLCSFLTPLEGSVTELDANNTIVDKQSVPVKRLDTIAPMLAERHGMRNVYVKLDTQGHDLEVIRGGEKTIAAARGLQSEVSVIPIYEGMPDFFTIFTFLSQRAFDISALVPVTRDSQQRVIEFDCVMVNRSVRTVPKPGV